MYYNYLDTTQSQSKIYRRGLKISPKTCTQIDDIIEKSKMNFIKTDTPIVLTQSEFNKKPLFQTKRFSLQSPFIDLNSNSSEKQGQLYSQDTSPVPEQTNLDTINKPSKDFIPLIPLIPLISQSKPLEIKKEKKLVVDQLKKYKILKKLGSGKYSQVYLAMHIETGFLVALKMIKKAQIIAEKMEKQLAWEIKIQYLLEHPNIAKLYTFFQTETEIVLVLEYCSEGQLYERLQSQSLSRFTERQAATYVYQVCNALSFMHQNEVIHRDIKPENILLSFGQAKMADFTFCIYSPYEYRQTCCGTLIYASPEVLSGELYDKSCDMWGLGVLAYELCFGIIPWDGEDKKQQIQSGQYKVPSAASRELKDFISNLVITMARDRMNAQQALRHRWLEQTQELMPFFLRRNQELFK